MIILIFWIQSLPSPESWSYQTVCPPWRNRRKRDKTWTRHIIIHEQCATRAEITISDDCKYPVNQDGLRVHSKLTLTGHCLCNEDQTPAVGFIC